MPPTPDNFDPDPLLRAHLASTLNPHLGRAAAAFRAQLRPPAPQRRLILRLALPVAVGLAASLVVAWTLVRYQRPSDNKVVVINPPATNKIAPAATPTFVQTASWSRVVDDGLNVIDDRPVRQLRRNLVQEVEWYDPKSHARVKQTIPAQQIFLIGVQTD